jgi:hypothetical protein
MKQSKTVLFPALLAMALDSGAFIDRANSQYIHVVMSRKGRGGNHYW